MQEVVFEEDHSLPNKTEIFFSRFTNLFEIGVTIIIIGVGYYLFSLFETESIILGSILILIGLYNLFTELKKTCDRKPQIIISNNGIETRFTGFKSWAVINSIEVTKERFIRSSKTYLKYSYDENKSVTIQIDDLNTTHEKLENLIRVYQARYYRNHPEK
ncbi:hypothetical protein [Flavobacterium pedocola]